MSFLFGSTVSAAPSTLMHKVLGIKIFEQVLPYTSYVYSLKSSRKNFTNEKKAGPTRKKFGPTKKNMNPREKKFEPTRKKFRPTRKKFRPTRKKFGPTRKKIGPTKARGHETHDGTIPTQISKLTKKLQYEMNRKETK